MVVHVDLQKGPQLLKMNLPSGPVKALSRKIERLLCFLFCCDVGNLSEQLPSMSSDMMNIKPQEVQVRVLEKDCGVACMIHLELPCPNCLQLVLLLVESLNRRL